MPTLYVTTPGTRVSLCGELLEIELPPSEEAPEGVRQTVALRDIEHAVLGRSIHITMPALAECLRRSIPVVFTSGEDDVLGLCFPAPPRNSGRLAQYGAALRSEIALAVARALVRAKILNARRVLQRLGANRRELASETAQKRLQVFADEAAAAATRDALRGLEGAAAGVYFEAYGGYYPETCPFGGRSRRPPLNAPNAILSYAYTLLAAEMEARVWMAGLDPVIGFYHETEDRRPALALDLIEPFRAPIADALALDLISHGTLHPEKHFESRDGGVFMNVEGKKRFFVAYERRMTRSFLSEQSGRRTTVREEMYRQAVALRQHLVNREAFEPFLMN